MNDNIRVYEEPSLKGRITIGRQVGYSKEVYCREQLIALLCKAQKALSKETDIKLSARLSEGAIIFAGQNEPCFILDFINYPKFPVTPKEMKQGVTFIAKKLLQSCHQNRIVAEFNDQTIMLDLSDEFDPGIELD